MVKRDEKGRLLPGSKLNTTGTTSETQAAWNKLKIKIGCDVDSIYEEIWNLIRNSKSDSTKGNLLIGLLSLLKPKNEDNVEESSIISFTKYQESLRTIVQLSEEVMELKNKAMKSKKSKND